MLRIDERELKAKLNEHKSLIGRGSVGDGIGNLVAGVFYILTVRTTSGLRQSTQWTLYGLGAIIIVIGVAALFSKRLSAAKLYKEIETMNRRPSSLIAVKDGGKLSNRYLTYYDEPWGCWFLPNHSSRDSYSEDKARMSEYLSTEFKIPEDDFTLGFLGPLRARNGPRSIMRNALMITGCIRRRCPSFPRIGGWMASSSSVRSVAVG